MADKKSFVMYTSWATMIAGMPEEQAGQLIKAICSKQVGKEYEISDQMVQAVFDMVLEKMDEDTEIYAESCKKRSENAKKQWGKKSAMQADANASEKNASAMQKDASASKKVQMHGDTDTESDTDTDKDNNPPTPFTIPGIVYGAAPTDLEQIGIPLTVAVKLSDWISNKTARKRPITETDLKSIVSKAKDNISKHGEDAVAKVIEDSYQYEAIIWEKLDRKARDKPKRAWEVTQKQDYRMDDLEARLLAN